MKLIDYNGSAVPVEKCVLLGLCRFAKAKNSSISEYSEDRRSVYSFRRTGDKIVVTKSLAQFVSAGYQIDRMRWETKQHDLLLQQAGAEQYLKIGDQDAQAKYRKIVSRIKEELVEHNKQEPFAPEFESSQIEFSTDLEKVIPEAKTKA